MTVADDYNLTACLTPWCLRKVSKSSVYCCAPCRVAKEGPLGPHEADHSEGCELRSVERGEWTQAQAEMKRRR